MERIVAGEERRRLLEEARRLSLSHGVPSIEPEDGAALYMAALLVARLRGAVAAVDAGAGIGYSSLWIAAGLVDGGCRGCILYAVERDPGLAAEARRLLERAPWTRGLARVVEGDAVEHLRSLSRVDLVFIDVDKESYPETVDIIAERLGRPGAALWHNAFFPRPPRSSTAAYRRGCPAGPWCQPLWAW